MKHLRIEYNNVILFDGEVAEISWQDNEDGVTLTGRAKKQQSGANLFDLLTAAAKSKTNDEVAERKADLEAEKAEKIARRAPVKKVVAQPVAAE